MQQSLQSRLALPEKSQASSNSAPDLGQSPRSLPIIIYQTTMISICMISICNSAHHLMICRTLLLMQCYCLTIA